MTAAEIIPIQRTSGVVHARVGPATVRTPDAVVVTAAPNPLAPPPSEVVRGTLVERPDCAVSGAKRPGGLSATVICGNDGMAFAVNPGQVFEGVVETDVVAPSGCAVTGRCVVEIIADTDTEFVAKSGGTVASAVSEIDAIVAQMNARYEADFNITFRILRYRIRLAGDFDPYADLVPPSVNPGGFLNTEIHGQWSQVWQVEDPRVDLVHLFLGRFWPTGGASPVGGACGTSRVSWSRAEGSGSTPPRVALAIHEFGHALGAHHWAGIMGTGAVTNPFATWFGAAGEIAPLRNLTTCMTANLPPIASATVSCGDNRTCAFDGRASTDEETLFYDWSLGDGQTSMLSNGSVTYSQSGTFQPTLTVTDSVGQTDSVSAGDAAASIFVDVPASHWARPFVEAIAAANITAGCGTNPRRFCPDTLVTKATASIFLLRARGVPPTPACTGTLFDDIQCTQPADPWCEELARLGIDSGCGNGDFCPGQQLTRAAIAPLLLKARFGSAYTPPSESPCTPTFTDVPCGHEQFDWIEDLASRGITSGCGLNTFCPAGNVSRASLAVFLTRAFGLPH